jgi:hypothetical protein
MNLKTVAEMLSTRYNLNKCTKKLEMLTETWTKPLNCLFNTPV